MAPAVWRPIKVPPLCCLMAPLVRRPRAGESQDALCLPASGVSPLPATCLTNIPKGDWDKGEKEASLSEGRSFESSRGPMKGIPGKMASGHDVGWSHSSCL